MDTHLRLGRTGEAAAEELYRRRGFTIVARNRRESTGELDLIARRGDLLVFCEVKTRRSDRWGAPSEAVGTVKQHRLKRLAARYLADEKPGAVDIRFDVVSVIVRGARTEITHIPDAF